ncbi:hypothetical protein [Capnocytophaga gingivalis]
MGIRCARAYDENGQKVWARELDLYGNAITGDSSYTKDSIMMRK